MQRRILELDSQENILILSITWLFFDFKETDC